MSIEKNVTYTYSIEAKSGVKEIIGALATINSLDVEDDNLETVAADLLGINNPMGVIALLVGLHMGSITKDGATWEIQEQYSDAYKSFDFQNDILRIAFFISPKTLAE